MQHLMELEEITQPRRASWLLASDNSSTSNHVCEPLRKRKVRGQIYSKR